MTATAQWDHLLSLAQDFGVMDSTRGAQETSEEEAEEEAEEEFIDDDQPENRRVPVPVLSGFGLPSLRAYFMTLQLHNVSCS